MSVRVMSLVWDNFRQGGSEKLVMLAMADWCNDEGLSLHPSHDAVAKKCCISRSQAQRVTKALVDAGWLQVIGNQFGGAPGTTKRYRMCVEKLRETDSANATGSVDATGSTQHVRRVAPSTETGSTHATQTTIEPPIEPPINPAPEKPARFDPLKIELPECINPESWEAWIAYRRKRKLTTNQTTMEAQVAELWRWHSGGHDPTEIIRTSITKGWQGLFEPKQGNQNASYSNFVAELTGRNRRENENFIDGQAERVD